LNAPEPPPDTPAEAAKPKSGLDGLRRRVPWMRVHTPLGWLLEAVLVLLLTAGVLILAIRVGPLTGEARRLIEARVNALTLPFGRLHIEGLQGDIWRDFKLRRLTIADAKGVWLQADDVEVNWRYAELLRSRLHLRSVAIQHLQLLRQPVIPPSKAPPGKAPAFSYALDALKARVELAPALAGRRGVYDVSGAADVQRNGGTAAKVDVESVLRPGDHLRANVNLGRTQSLLLDADVLEVKGGAIAGILGLAADQPFDLTAHLSGAISSGKLALVARSGGQTPVQAQGAWTPSGGGVSAHVVLGASRWTAGLVGMFGPQAEIAVIGKQRPGSPKGAVYDLDTRFIADNLVLMARGPADLAKRSSGGLALSVVVKNLKKLTPAPAMDEGRATGMLSGDLGDLRFAGNAEVTNLELLGWRLKRAFGAVKVGWKKGQLDVQGDLNGQGGGGEGLIAQAGGATPHIVTQVVRLKDGRLLIKSLDATGNGLKLQGTGGQNFLNQGLQFKGDAQVTDMAKFAPGSSGIMQGSWSATQDNGPDKPWLFTVEGQGQHYASGTPEIDRLLGPEPKLTIAASLLGDTVTVSKAAVEGAKERASAEGVWAFSGDMRFNLDWAAEGPFGFGPFEVDGKAKGSGVLAGTLQQPKAELTAAFDSIAFPDLTVKAAKLDLTFAAAKDGSDGTVALTGQTDYGPARARSAFRFSAGGIDLTGIDADAGGVKAKGALALRDGAPSSADLTLAITTGALLSEGQAAGSVNIVDAKGGATASLDLQAKGAVVRGQPLALATARITASGPLARLPYKINADGAWLRTPVKIDGSGVFTRDPHGYSAEFSGSGNLRRAPFKTLEPVQVRLDDNDHFARLRLSLGGGKAELDGRQTNGALNLTANLTGVDLSFLSEDFTGQFDADVVAVGQGANLHGTLDAELKNARSRDARKGLSIDGVIKAALVDDRITVNAKLNSQQGLTSTADLVLPAEASAAPFRIALVRTKPMQGTFQADGEIQPLWDLFLGGERTLGGRLMAKADLAGTLADPKITGRADLMNGQFADYATGLKLRDLTVGAALNTDTIALDKFQAGDGLKGQVSGSGQVSLARGGGSTLTLNLNSFRLIDNDTAQADATGQVSVTRDADGKAKIAGTLDLVRADINAAARTGPSIVTMDVIEKNRPFRIDEQLAPTPAAGGGQPTGIGIDVALKAKKGVLVKGRGLDVDMSLDARVTGTTAKPVLDGEAHVVRGAYDFAGKRFEFDDRGVVRLSNDPNQIRLDLTATREDPSLTAVIRIQGTAAKPQIALSSTPVLPTDEVLSQVLFGASASQLSPLEAAQLASALTALAGGGGFDVIGGLRSFARLDRLALVGGGGSQTGVNVAGGKYLSDNVYVELAGGGRAGPSVQVEYRVTKNLSLVSSLANQTTTQGGGQPQGGAQLSVRWRHDFKDKVKK
jgi:translocation and assembly module TamB